VARWDIRVYPQQNLELTKIRINFTLKLAEEHGWKVITSWMLVCINDHEKWVIFDGMHTSQILKMPYNLEKIM